MFFHPDKENNGFLPKLLASFTHWTYEYHGREGLVCGFRGFANLVPDITVMDMKYVFGLYLGHHVTFIINLACHLVLGDRGMLITHTLAHCKDSPKNMYVTQSVSALLTTAPTILPWGPRLSWRTFFVLSWCFVFLLSVWLWLLV